VARRLGVHRQSVIRWTRQLAQPEPAGLKKAGRTDRKAKLTAAQLQQIEQGLKPGPEALGYNTGLWTNSRVRDLIESECGCVITKLASGAILRSLSWSCRPSSRALQRDEHIRAQARRDVYRGVGTIRNRRL
jgi:transposase